MQFPTNPSDGTIFEAERGLYFIYDTSSKSWNKLEGDLNPILATPLAPGLMSHEDLNKLNRLIIPPISTTLQANDSDIVFGSGVISLTSGEQKETDTVVMHVEGTAPLMNVAASIDRNNAEVIDRVLHLDSNSFDFYVDIDEFRNLIEAAGGFKVIQRSGKDGIPGDPGQDGEDRLSRGPDGEKGDPGRNAPIVANLSSDPVKFEEESDGSEFRGVVGISVEEVSPEENYLVLTRASIGDPEASPNTVKLGKVPDATWLIVAPIVNINDVNVQRDVCIQDAGQVYYLDIEPILSAIRSEFETEVEYCKKGMERVVDWWLTLMAMMFDEQKNALCCALEYCRSQSRNAETRRYIEQSRLNAARDKASIIIDTNPKSGENCDVSTTVMHPACGEGFGTISRLNTPNNAEAIGSGNCVPITTVIDGEPYKFRECPPGTTPRTIIDGRQPLPTGLCTPKVLGSFTTNSNSPVWDLTAFKGRQNTGRCKFWRLIEIGSCYPNGAPWYGSGCISNNQLLDLPNEFRSTHYYDGFLELQLGCLSGLEIIWPGECQNTTPLIDCGSTVVENDNPSPSAPPLPY